MTGYTDWDDGGWEPADSYDSDVLPRPAAVDCGTPELCQWRRYSDDWWMRCDTPGCGAEHELSQEAR